MFNVMPHSLMRHWILKSRQCMVAGHAAMNAECSTMAVIADWYMLQAFAPASVLTEAASGSGAWHQEHKLNRL